MLPFSPSLGDIVASSNAQDMLATIPLTTEQVKRAVFSSVKKRGWLMVYIYICIFIKKKYYF
jgi:hypothetical protein